MQALCLKEMLAKFEFIAPDDSGVILIYFRF